MGYSLTLTDEQYQVIKQVADSEGRSLEELFLKWAMEEEARYRRAHPTYYTTDEWMRHLGASEQEIQEIEAELAADQ